MLKTQARLAIQKNGSSNWNIYIFMEILLENMKMHKKDVCANLLQFPDVGHPLQRVTTQHY